MKSELVPIASLSLDPANLRKHPEKNLQAIVASLKRFGQQKPIVIDANGIVRAGNGTLLAAKQLGWNEIEIVRSTLKGSEATAYAIADNRTAELADWDTDALGAALEALRAEGEGLDLAAGFDESEIKGLLAEIAEQNEEPIDLPIGMQLVPTKKYLVIVCENESEWERCVQRFKLERVRRGGCDEGSSMDTNSIERVIAFSRAEVER